MNFSKNLEFVTNLSKWAEKKPRNGATILKYGRVVLFIILMCQRKSMGYGFEQIVVVRMHAIRRRKK